MSEERHGSPSAKPAALPDDACPVCGVPMVESRGALSYPVNGQDVWVPDVPHLRCPVCGEVVLRRDDARRLRGLALARYREEHHLLSAEEIRTLRERLGLTQSELARLLRLGANTVSRWESGRNVQAAAMDMLLRLIRDVPGTLEYLRRQIA